MHPLARKSINWVFLIRLWIWWLRTIVCKEFEFQLTQTLHLNLVQVSILSHFAICRVGLEKNASLLSRDLRFFTSRVLTHLCLRAKPWRMAAFTLHKDLPWNLLPHTERLEVNLAVACSPKSADCHLLLRIYFSTVLWSARLCAENTVVSPGNFRKAPDFPARAVNLTHHISISFGVEDWPQ